MSSLHRQKGKPYWFCAFRSKNGTQRFRSTGTNIKAEAKIICDKMAEVGRAARKRRLEPEKARKIIEATVAAVVEECGHVLPHSSIREYFLSWLQEKKVVGADTTFARYEGIVAKFVTFLGHRADLSLGNLAKDDILTFRSELLTAVAPGTVNTYLKVLRVALGRAVREQLMDKNPAALVESVSRKGRHERRAFSVEELKKLLSLASADWQGMILCSLYLGGLRLQDNANLCENNIDLSRAEVTVTARKTDRTQILPIAKPLLKYFESRTAGDDPRAPLFRSLYGKSSSWLSNQFFDLMATAGLVKARDHQSRDKGRGKRRELNAISFHSLRHTATSLLKNAGVSDVIARDIVGHESVAVSRNYTHIDMETKRKAIDTLPDLFG